MTSFATSFFFDWARTDFFKRPGPLGNMRWADMLEGDLIPDEFCAVNEPAQENKNTKKVAEKRSLFKQAMLGACF